MKKFAVTLGLLVLAASSRPAFAQGAAAAAPPAGRQVQVTEKILPLRIPGETLGETEGVSLNSAGHLFVFSRTGWSGSSRGGNAARAFEFDNNPRVVKLAPDGTWLKEFGSYGSGDGQFNTVHSIAAGYGHVYVADRANRRIQVFDYDLNFERYITGIGMPWAVQITPKYIYSGDGDGKIYRLDHDGKLIDWAQTGMGQGQTGCIVHTLQAVSDTELYRG